MRFTFDTNILLYALVEEDQAKRHTARDLVRRARARDCVITLQALGETFRALTGKFRRSPAEAAAVVLDWRSAMPVVAANEACLVDAMDAVAGHGLSFWDAMLWATAKHADCQLLVTEDGQDGFALGGVTWVNPFVLPRSSLLVEALRAAR